MIQSYRVIYDRNEPIDEHLRTPPLKTATLSRDVRVTPTRRVCVLIDTSTSWGARLIKGVGRYAQEVGNWLLNVEPWGRYERFRVPEGWEGDGLIARINRQALADEIMASGLPTVNVSWYPFAGERIALHGRRPGIWSDGGRLFCLDGIQAVRLLRSAAPIGLSRRTIGVVPCEN